VWPDQRVVSLVTGRFLPARVHVKDQAADFKRFGAIYGAQWTPTILMLDPEGVERHRIEGFLPLDDFLSEVWLGLGHIAFHAGSYEDAEGLFEKVLSQLPASEGAPAAQYWAGVSRYKASGDAKDLVATAAAFKARYQDSVWAKKASVWG
jgi:tetratricopeptide (TPR) repeat protein